MAVEYSVLIPVKNEAESLRILVPLIMREMDKLQEPYEVLFINDNNSDNSELILNQFQRSYPALRYISIPTNRFVPLGIAFRYGIKHAKGKYIISMDGDGSHDPASISFFVSQKRAGKIAIIGVRYLPNQREFTPKSRYIISKAFNLLTRFILKRKICDYTSGYRLFLRSIGNTLTAADWDAHIELNLKISRLPSELIGEVPIFYKKRVGGKSKLKYLRIIVKYGFQILREITAIKEKRQYPDKISPKKH